MPSTDRATRNATWYRWYLKNKAKHHESCRKTQKRRRAVVRKMLAEMKLARGCSKCGYKRCAAALDYHHRAGEVKKFSIGEMGSRQCGDAKILAEISKCELLCANCHREEHYMN